MSKMLPEASTDGLLLIIPARGGSKGIPGKNVRNLAGRPLIAHTIAFARDLGLLERTIVSTDSALIADVSREAGASVPFLRPEELARDDTPMLPVLQHAVQHAIQKGWRPDLVVLLQPTAPFRRPADLLAALQSFEDEDVDSVVSVERVPDHFSPHYVMRIQDGRLAPYLSEGSRVTRRQDAPPAYTRNGQFYVTRTKCLMEGNSIYGTRCLPFVTMHPAANLDTLEDWAEAEKLMGA